MLKKVVIGVAAAGLLSVVSFGRDAWSYLRTAGHTAQEAIRQEVPIEFELQRARDLVSQLIPDIRHCMHVIAEEEVNVEELGREIAASEKGLAKQKDELLALRKQAGPGTGVYQVSGRTYSKEAVQRDLAHRFTRFKTAEETLSSKRQILTAREQSLSAAREKLDGLLAARRDLDVQIEHLDARVKTLQAAQTASHVVVDGSRLAQAKKLIRDLNKQLDITEKMLDAEGKFTGLIPVETGEEATEDVTAQIDAHFQVTPAAPADGVEVASDATELTD